MRDPGWTGDDALKKQLRDTGAAIYLAPYHVPPLDIYIRSIIVYDNLSRAYPSIILDGIDGRWRSV